MNFKLKLTILLYDLGLYLVTLLTSNGQQGEDVVHLIIFTHVMRSCELPCAQLRVVELDVNYYLIYSPKGEQERVITTS